MKKGQVGKSVYMGGQIPYFTDPYDHKKILEKKEREEHHKKLQDKPFSNMIKRTDAFNSVKETIGEDRDYLPKKSQTKRPPLMTHDAAFKPANPAKNGHNKTLAKFPEYVPDPLKFATRKKEDNTDSKPRWRPSYQSRSVPSSSVVTSTRNLRVEFPSIFRR